MDRKWRSTLTIISAVAVILFIWSGSWPSADVNSKHTDRSNSANMNAVSRPSQASALPNRIITEHLLSAGESSGAKQRREQECWERIRQQYDASDTTFIRDHQSELNHIVGAWFYKPFADSQVYPTEVSVAGKFLLALAKAGLLEGVKIPEDFIGAIALLKEVVSRDPKNSAPELYLGVIQRKLGFLLAADELSQVARRTDHFDSYVLNFTEALYKNVNSPSDLLAVEELWGRAPIPNFSVIKELLVETHQPDLAKQLLQDGLNDPAPIPDLQWLPIEYSTGKSILKDLRLGDEFPSFHDLRERHAKAAAVDNEVSAHVLDASCDLRSLENEVKKVQDHFRR